MRYLKSLTAIICYALLAGMTACESSTPGSTPVPSATSSPRPQPTSVMPLTPTELKYALFARFGETFYCDPDFYPVARRDEMEIALEKFPEMQKETEKFQAMLKHLGLNSGTTFSDEQKLTIYRVYKRLNSISLEPAGEQYKFSLRIPDSKDDKTKGKSIEGTITVKGEIKVTKEDVAFLTCPICLAKGTFIDTPNGAVPVEALQSGDPIWTMDAAGNRVSSAVMQVSHAPAPAAHMVMHIVLADGLELYASPSHPTADGRALGDIAVGNELNGARVITADLVNYTYRYTYDVLPSGDTGVYWANGILLMSTLHK